MGDSFATFNLQIFTKISSSYKPQFTLKFNLSIHQKKIISHNLHIKIIHSSRCNFGKFTSKWFFDDTLPT